jgi:GMC family mycofactocin-associated oxidreductase
VSRGGSDEVVVVEAGGAPPPVGLDILPLADASRVRVLVDREGTPLPRGRGLGGSSAVNGGYFLRAHVDDLAVWDRSVWAPEVVEQAYTVLDGGAAGGGMMSVRRFGDDELHPRAAAFEDAMREGGRRFVDDVWPGAGVVRVRTNALGMTRRTAAAALLTAAASRPGVRVVTDVEADRVEIVAGTVRSVVTTGGSVIRADVVVLCAGTLGSAAIAARSGLPSTMPLAEHRELLVRSRATPAVDAPVGAVLQTVVHTGDGFEIRCYGHDFADHVKGVPRSGPAIGVAAMRSVGAGSIAVTDGGALKVDLGRPDDAAVRRMRDLADEVVDMLEGPAFGDLVEPGSTMIDEHLSTSHHAWGALALGAAADWDGRVRGVDGLWVADAAALPTPLSSGPHATVMMLASVIGDRIRTSVLP